MIATIILHVLHHRVLQTYAFAIRKLLSTVNLFRKQSRIVNRSLLHRLTHTHAQIQAHRHMYTKTKRTAILRIWLRLQHRTPEQRLQRTEDIAPKAIQERESYPNLYVSVYMHGCKHLFLAGCIDYHNHHLLYPLPYSQTAAAARTCRRAESVKRQHLTKSPNEERNIRFRNYSATYS